jgi:hypothetical protein
MAAATATSVSSVSAMASSGSSKSSVWRFLATGAIEAVLLEAQRLQQTVYLVLQLSNFGLLFNEQRHPLGGGIRECFINRFHGVGYTAPSLSYGVEMLRIKGLIAPQIKAVE